MGIFWIMDPISSFFEDSQRYFYLTDAINCLQGLVIFVMFVIKKKVLKLLKKRYEIIILSTQCNNDFIWNIYSCGCASEVNPTKSSTISNLSDIRNISLR